MATVLYNQKFYQVSLLFRLICENFANIDKLSIAAEDNNFLTNPIQLGELKQLRRLDLNLDYTIDVLPLMEKMLQNNIELHHLCIANSTISDATCDIISQMKSIRSLKLLLAPIFYDQDSINRLLNQLPALTDLFIIMVDNDENNILDTVKEIILNGPQLTNIFIYWECGDSSDIREKEYNELLEIVKKRKDPKKLTVKIIGIFLHHKFEILAYVDMDMESDFLDLKVRYHLCKCSPRWIIKCIRCNT